MRIRKRQVPFPLSSLSPVPLSDPHLINRSPVVQLIDATPPKPTTLLPEEDASSTISFHMDHRPSDQQLPPIGKAREGWDCSGNGSGSGIPKVEDCLAMCQTQEQDGGGGEKDNDTRKGGILGSETAAQVLPPSRQAEGRWCDGEKAIPLKKRRGTFDMSENNNKKMKTRMKTKMNKKCSTTTWTQNDNEVEDEEKEEEEEERKPDLNVGKKRARGSALMEGSRCSRVNGRGWRCCQQTLVGYSLCEHHLGKGRLRSMTSVRSRSAATSTTTTTTAPKKNEPVSVSESTVSESDPIVVVAADSSSSSPEKKLPKCDDEEYWEEKEEKKPLMSTKKRMKLGMVKARSISSLLGQTNTATEIAVAENNK
ncbi:hypothetical protein L6164_009466 [Bauhinia variegata]|uniref:Uncharacterized protein n=1 Tax=Bauhinia variegata TaxID=167791 RepID=A0ACB9PK69_BAUVA|nr:hypothetical protein L6164_009466 [Bauhinia variegata]